MVNAQPTYIHHVEDSLHLCRLGVRRIDQSRTHIEHSDQRISNSVARLLEMGARERLLPASDTFVITQTAVRRVDRLGMP
jgi:hypothetical protein